MISKMFSPTLALLALMPAAPSFEADRVQTVRAETARTVHINIYEPETARGVILFGYGFGGYPEAYSDAIDHLKHRGWMVLAPLNVDSQHHPDVALYQMPETFGPRLADLAAAAELAGEIAPGKPIVAMSHSYGSLFSLIAICATTKIGAGNLGDIKTAIAFSSPGIIPGVVTEQGLSAIDRPVMMITGDKDIVPGFIPDAQAHLAAYTANDEAGQSVIVVKHGGHDLIREPGPVRNAILAAVDDFLDGRILGQDDALAREEACTPLMNAERICR